MQHSMAFTVSSLLSFCCQFHQCFMSNFCTNILAPKTYKAKLYIEKSYAKHFRTKKSCIKCWWKWHQFGWYKPNLFEVKCNNNISSNGNSNNDPNNTNYSKFSNSSNNPPSSKFEILDSISQWSSLCIKFLAYWYFVLWPCFANHCCKSGLCFDCTISIFCSFFVCYDLLYIHLKKCSLFHAPACSNECVKEEQ